MGGFLGYARNDMGPWGWQWGVGMEWHRGSDRSRGEGPGKGTGVGMVEVALRGVRVRGWWELREV